MPLNEREQQILQEIERHLLDEEPATRRAHAKSRLEKIKLGAFLFICGLVGLIAFFVTSALIIGVVAFAAMVAGIAVILSGFRFSIPESSSRGDGLSGIFGSWNQKLRDRFKRSD